MAQASHGDYVRGKMEIADQRQTFGGFMATALWVSTLIAQSTALFTLAFAIGAGWWAGLAAYLVIGVAVGLFFKMGGAWWATLAGALVLLAIGGALVPFIVGLAG